MSEENQGYSVDEALDVLNGTNQEPEQQEEPAQEQPDNQQPETPAESVQAEEQPADVEQEEPAEEQSAETETPALDYSMKVKFRANGQEVEKSIQDLITEAQLASNYNQKMQELAAQRKAYEASLQQQQAQQKPDPVKTFEELSDKVTARAMQMLGITDPSQFEPDALGIMGSKVHFAAYQKALLEVQQQEQSAQAQQREQQEVEQHYAATMQSYAQDKEFNNINKYAEQALFLLPQSGAEGIAEFNELYGIYQNLQLRDRAWAEVQQFGRTNIQIPPLSRRQVDKLISFYDKCKVDYTAKQQKEQVKAQVPKSVPIKPTVKVETTGNNEPVPTKKPDFKKMRSMEIDDIVKLL